MRTCFLLFPGPLFSAKREQKYGKEPNENVLIKRDDSENLLQDFLRHFHSSTGSASEKGDDMEDSSQKIEGCKRYYVLW